MIEANFPILSLVILLPILGAIAVGAHPQRWSGEKNRAPRCDS